MGTIWFIFLVYMLAVYVILDGFDLGAGVLNLWVAKTETERRMILNVIMPVWGANEVWLLAAGAVLFMAFPAVYAASFSGLYFGLILAVWLIVGRGLGLELRHELDNDLWRRATDTIFGLSSLLLTFVFGVALGNVIRGVPLNSDGFFHLPLFSILNWYALLVGLFAVIAVVAHGANFLAWRTAGDLQKRCALWAKRLFWVEVLAALGLIGPTWVVRDGIFRNVIERGWTAVFILLTIVGILTLVISQRAERWGQAFASSAALIGGVLATVAAGLYPNILPARAGDLYSMTVTNSVIDNYALRIGVVWWAIGMILISIYFLHLYRFFFFRNSSKLSAQDSV